ncbi:hypothetical protein V8C37DRAFT_383006 [Trichoderma ceciliae]
MAASVSWTGAINVCLCILDQETNAFESPDKPTIFLVTLEDERPESEEPTHAKQIPAPGVSSLDKYVNNWEAVTISDTFTRRGRGIFAARDFRKGHNIIVEPPIITCTHWAQNNGSRTIAEEWCALPLEDQLQLRTIFRKRLRYVPVGQDTIGPFYRRMLENFVLEYGFCNPQRSLAHIYVLASHINHACNRCANAQQWTESDVPHRIIVKLVKPLKMGDELFINYNRRQGSSFGCAVCGPPSMMDRLKSLCNTLFWWFPRFTTRTTRTTASTTTSTASTNVASKSQADTHTTHFNPSPWGGAKWLRDKAIDCWRRLFAKRERPNHPAPGSPEEQ